MKKLLLSLMVLATLVSCGKDNNVSTGANSNGMYSDLLNNPHLSGSYYQLALSDAHKALQDPNHYFGTMQLMINSGNNSKCKTKWFGTYCTYSSSSNSGQGNMIKFNALVAQNPNLIYRYSDGQQVVHSYVNIDEKRNELANIFAHATALDYFDYHDGRIFRVRVNNDYYEIDTRYSIQANPTRVNSRYLYNIQ